MLYEIDQNYGEQAEKKAILQLQIFFDNKLIKLDYYNPFDFYMKQNVYI